MGCLVLPQISLFMPPKSLLRVGFGGEGFTPQSPAPISTLPMGNIFGTNSFTPQNSTPPAPLGHCPFSYSPHGVRWDAPTPKTHNIGFPHPREQVGSAAPDGRQELERGGGPGGPGTPKATEGSDTMLPFTGPRRGSRPFLPRHNRGGPRAPLVCIVRPAAPHPTPPTPAPPFCPPSDNGSALCAWLDKDFVSEKETVFVCQKRLAKKGTGRSGGCSGAASLAAPRSIGLARPPLRHPKSQRGWGKKVLDGKFARSHRANPVPR